MPKLVQQPLMNFLAMDYIKPGQSCLSPSNIFMNDMNIQKQKSGSFSLHSHMQYFHMLLCGFIMKTGKKVDSEVQSYIWVTAR